MSQDQAREDPAQPPEAPPKQLPQSPAEWVSFGIAAAIVMGIVATVIYLWLQQRHQSPPVVTVATAAEIRQAKQQYYVPFTVTNTGGETATRVQVVAELRVDGRVVEAGDQQVDFLSSQEQVEGAFVFGQDPRQGDLTVRVTSYQLP